MKQVTRTLLFSLLLSAGVVLSPNAQAQISIVVSAKSDMTANGTQLNGMTIKPHQPYRLRLL